MDSWYRNWQPQWSWTWNAYWTTNRLGHQWYRRWQWGDIGTGSPPRRLTANFSSPPSTMRLIQINNEHVLSRVFLSQLFFEFNFFFFFFCFFCERLLGLEAQFDFDYSDHLYFDIVEKLVRWFDWIGSHGIGLLLFWPALVSSIHCTWLDDLSTILCRFLLTRQLHWIDLKGRKTIKNRKETYLYSLQ